MEFLVNPFVAYSQRNLMIVPDTYTMKSDKGRVIAIEDSVVVARLFNCIEINNIF